MISSHFPKIVLLGILFLTVATLKAQDTVKMNAASRVNWLIKLSEIKTVDEVVDSIHAKDYAFVGKHKGTGNDMSLTVICRITEKMEYCGFASEDGEEVTDCFYETYDINMYNQILGVIQTLGFKPTSLFEAGVKETAYSEGNSLLIFKVRKLQKKTSYTLVASKLVI